MSIKLSTLYILVFTISFTVNAQVNQLDLPVGWSLFGSTCVDSIDVIEGFIDISDDIEIIKDELGMSYLPSWNFNAIGSLHYSEGYQIKMLNEVLGFQLCSSVIPEDGIGQAEVDAAYALGAASVIPEDGISQFDITAAIDSVNAVWMSIPTPFSSAQGVTDMAAIYQDLSTYEGGTPHALVFGGGEVLYPGVYDVTGAASISIGSLTLDGGGDPNSVFIIRSTGAFTTGVGATIILTNGANSRNIFWMSEAAISTAANTIIKGTFVSPAGAIALGAGTLLEGRMFTKLGALTTVTGCNVTIPLGDSPIDLGLLSSFAMWTSGGAISDAATSTTIGDVGTASGALTISGSLTGVEYPAGTE